MKVRILPAAKEDLELAADYYESRQEGLGITFLDSLIADIDRLSIHGGVHRIEFGFHRSVCRKFPFIVYYLVGSNAVDVYAVVDYRQDPEKTKKQLHR